MDVNHVIFVECVPGMKLRVSMSFWWYVATMIFFITVIITVIFNIICMLMILVIGQLGEM